MKVPEDYVFVCMVDGTKITACDISQIRAWKDGTYSLHSSLSMVIVHSSRSVVIGSLGITSDSDTVFWRDDKRFPEMLSRAFALAIMQ